MPRQNEDTTILNTTIADVYAKLLDAYIEQETKNSVLKRKRLSRTVVTQDAVLWFLYTQGTLEPLLKKLAVPDGEIRSTIARLKAEYCSDVKEKP